MKIKEGFDEAGIAVTGVQQCFEDLNKVQGGLEEKVIQVEERFKTFSSSAKELAESVNALNSALKGGDEKEEKGLLDEEYLQRYIDLLGREYDAEKTHNELLKDLKIRRGRLVETTYSAMEQQMLSLVETGKFSLKGFGDVMFQQVKIELVGLAAKAAVNAIYQTAVGFATLYSNPPMSFAAFKSAAFFGAVSGASLAAASQVQSSFFGGTGSGSSSGGGTAAAASMTDAVPLNNNQSTQETQQTQQITVNIYNPLSEQNWQEIAENNIIPALKDASERNIELTVVTV